MANRKKMVVFIFIAILLLFLVVASVLIYGSLTEEEVTDFWDGREKYTEYENNRLELKVVNQSKKEEELFVYIWGYVELWPTGEEHWKGKPVVLTNHEEYASDSVTINDVIKIYIDGEECEKFIIPKDGKEHDVIIDFNEVYNAYEFVELFETLEIKYFGQYDLKQAEGEAGK